MKPFFDLSLYLVTDSSMLKGRRMSDVICEAVRGGVTMVQLREKEACTRDFYNQAIQLKKSLSPFGIPLIINDRIDIALACQAEGVHIGQSDMPYPDVRRLLGPDKIIGLSVENQNDVHTANEFDVDYIGISPVFNTTTKTDTAPAVGLEGLARLSQQSVHPSVGIGGMNSSSIADVILHGADGVAVVSAIMAAANPFLSSRELYEIIENTKKIKQGQK